MSSATSKSSLIELNNSGTADSQRDLISDYLTTHGPTCGTDVWAAVLPTVAPEMTRFSDCWKLGRIRKTGGIAKSATTGRDNEVWEVVPDLAIPKRKAIREYWESRMADLLVKEATMAATKASIQQNIDTQTDFITVIETAQAAQASLGV